MLSPILLAKCLAIGWVPIAWSLFQSSAGARPYPVSTEAKIHPAEKDAAAENGSSLFEGRALSEARSPLPGSAHSAQKVSASPIRSVGQAISAPESSLAGSKSAPAIERSPLSIDPTSTEKQAEKPPETLTPRLEAFFEETLDSTDSAIAAFPPEQTALSQTPSNSETDAPPSEESQPAPDEVLPSAPRDPELGVIQVADPRRDPELGFLQLRNPLQDPELGILELRQFSPPPPPRPFLFVSAYVSASSSDNVFLVEDPVQGRFSDNFIRPGISITAFPALGPRTNLLASAETNLLRYEEQSASSYDEIRLRAAIRHRFSDRVYGQVGFSSQLLFDEGYDDQFFTNNGIEVTIGRRDPLTPQLTLDTFYQGQVFFSDPSEFSNVLNSVGAYLGYRFAPQWDTGIGYRLTISDFTRQNRHETYQRITGQLRYTITPSVRVSVFGGLSYGRSSEDRITFDDSFFGISFDATIQVF